MRNLLLLILFAVCATPAAFAQTTSDDYHKASSSPASHTSCGHRLADEDLNDDPGFTTILRHFFDQSTGFTALMFRDRNFHPSSARSSLFGSLQNRDFVLEPPADVRRRFTRPWRRAGQRQRTDSGSRLKPFAHALVGVGIAELSSAVRTTSEQLRRHQRDRSRRRVRRRPRHSPQRKGGLACRATRLQPDGFFDSTQHNFRVGVGLVFH